MVPEQPSENLARRTLGNDIDELDAAGKPLVASLFLFDVLGDTALDHGIALLQADRLGLDHESLGDLASSLVGDGDDGAIGDGGVIE